MQKDLRRSQCWIFTNSKCKRAKTPFYIVPEFGYIVPEFGYIVP